MIKYALFPTFLILLGCASKAPSSSNPPLVSIQVIDRNGFAETVSSKDRLAKYQSTNFCDPQPYQKVFCVFEKDKEGKSPSQITNYHSNGYIRQYLEVVDGRAHGVYREWHPNGHLKMDCFVIEGSADLSDKAFASWVFEGENKIFDENGSLLALIPYEKGLLQGTSTYYREGQIQKTLPYSQDKLEGTALSYSKEGLILESIPYVQDEKEGKAFGLTKEGYPLYEEFFQNGLLRHAVYYNKKREEITHIVDGTGKKAEFIEDELSQLIEYKNGLPDGLVECFSPEGCLYISYAQKEGKKHGEEKEYYKRSSPQDPCQVKILLHWHEDILQGAVKTWFLDGKQESQKELYQNKKNGLSYAWYKNGGLLLMEEYENDVLVNGTYYKKGDTQPVSRVIQGKGTATLYDADGYFLKKIPYEKGLPIIEG